MQKQNGWRSYQPLSPLINLALQRMVGDQIGAGGGGGGVSKPRQGRCKATRLRSAAPVVGLVLFVLNHSKMHLQKGTK
jgi:hypothetical protein